MNEKKFEYSVCYIAKCVYFQCNLCNRLFVLDYPDSYAEAEEQYIGLTEQHKHG